MLNRLALNGHARPNLPPADDADDAAPVPRPTEVGAKVAALQQALFGAITPDHLAKAVQAVAGKAAGGDLRAAQTLFDLVRPADAPLIVNQQAVVLNHRPADPPAQPDHLRRLAGMLLDKHGATVGTALARLMGVDKGTVEGLLTDDPRFGYSVDGWSLTEAGRREFA